MNNSPASPALSSPCFTSHHDTYWKWNTDHTKGQGKRESGTWVFRASHWCQCPKRMSNVPVPKRMSAMQKMQTLTEEIGLASWEIVKKTPQAGLEQECSGWATESRLVIRKAAEPWCPQDREEISDLQFISMLRGHNPLKSALKLAGHRSPWNGNATTPQCPQVVHSSAASFRN